ncbi:MAG: hypothetical protein M3068_10505 [Gemmatimonadota bacterium]|nr:hypothetical protein [Gemmatimonadota bacterium]
MIAALLLVLMQQGGSQRPGVQLGVLVQPETVTVGDPFVVTIRVRAPRNARIEFPRGPDSASAVEALDPPLVIPSPDSASTEQSARYRLVAWDTGLVRLGLADIAVTTAPGVGTALSLGDARVFVRSVLPADSAARIPKGARDILSEPPATWRWWIIALLIAAMIGLLIWLWLRRRGRVDDLPPVNALDEAEREFERIDALRLLEAGERGRYVALNIDVLRDYLAARLPAGERSLTSNELLLALHGEPRVPSERLAPTLAETDLIKFARRAVTTDQARALAQDARHIVRAVEHAIATPAADAREAA